MAWAGIVMGMAAGLCAAILSYTAAGLPLWLSLLMYPAAGTAVAILVIAALLLRDITAGPDLRRYASKSEAAAA